MLGMCSAVPLSFCSSTPLFPLNACSLSHHFAPPAGSCPIQLSSLFFPSQSILTQYPAHCCSSLFLCHPEKGCRLGYVHAVEGASGVLAGVLVWPWGAGRPSLPPSWGYPAETAQSQPLALLTQHGQVPEPKWVTVLGPCASLSFGTKRSCRGNIFN